MPFLIPAIGYTAAALGGTAGVTGLTSSAVSAFEPLSEALGQTERQQAENEVFDRTADPGRRINRDLNEKFFDFFMGRNQDKMEEFGLNKDNIRINREITNAGYDLNEITSALKALNLDQSLTPKLNDNQSLDSYQLELNRAKKAIQAAQTAQAMYPGIDITGKDITGINLELAKAQKAEKEKDKALEEDKYQDLIKHRDRQFYDQRTARDNARKDTLMFRQEERSDLLRQQIRQDKQAEANRLQQFQIQQMQLGLENRRLDMREARDYRKDKQLAIMQIMKGLANMGAAFAL